MSSARLHGDQGRGILTSPCRLVQVLLTRHPPSGPAISHIFGGSSHLALELEVTLPADKEHRIAWVEGYFDPEPTRQVRKITTS